MMKTATATANDRKGAKMDAQKIEQAKALMEEVRVRMEDAILAVQIGDFKAVAILLNATIGDLCWVHAVFAPTEPRASEFVG